MFGPWKMGLIHLRADYHRSARRSSHKPAPENRICLPAHYPKNGHRASTHEIRPARIDGHRLLPSSFPMEAVRQKVIQHGVARGVGISVLVISCLRNEGVIVIQIIEVEEAEVISFFWKENTGMF